MPQSASVMASAGVVDAVTDGRTTIKYVVQAALSLIDSLHCAVIKELKRKKDRKQCTVKS